jgi:hypothetical protein
MSRSKDGVKLDDILGSFSEQKHLKSGLKKVRAEQAWKEVMGPGVNHYTVSVSYRSECLHVILNSSVLREELSYGKQKIIGILNDHLGENTIKEIFLK